MRREVKFLLTQKDDAWARSYIFRHKAGFLKEYEDRYVNNLYFDTPDFKNYYDNLNGISDRVKVRLRWYGDMTRLDRPALELKHKRNAYGWKRVHKVNQRLFLKYTQWQELIRGLHSPIIKDIIGSMGYRATLCNRYLREYYRSGCRRFRLTLDTHLIYMPQYISSTINLDLPRLVKTHTIVEVKTERKNELELESICCQFPFRITKSSKYMIGMGENI